MSCSRNNRAAPLSGEQVAKEAGKVFKEPDHESCFASCSPRKRSRFSRSPTRKVVSRAARQRSGRGFQRADKESCLASYSPDKRSRISKSGPGDLFGERLLEEE